MISTENRSIDYVFGYGSLVELKEPLVTEGRVFPAVPGRLGGFRRFWGAAMNNWEATGAEKHFVDPASGLKPHIRVAYLDVAECPGSSVNGLAVPVDAPRLAELDVREVNYSRIDVSPAFIPSIPHRVFTYVGTEAARERSRLESPDTAVHVSRQYVDRVKRAFLALGPGELAEYERTTEPSRFLERDLELRYPRPSADGVA